MPQIPRAPSPCRRGGGAESGSLSPSSEGPPGAAELESRVLGSRAGTAGRTPAAGAFEICSERNF